MISCRGAGCKLDGFWEVVRGEAPPDGTGGRFGTGVPVGRAGLPNFLGRPLESGHARYPRRPKEARPKPVGQGKQPDQSRRNTRLRGDAGSPS